MMGRKLRYELGSLFRHPRTTQEHRENLGADADGLPQIRRKRLGRNLPTAYDDIKHGRRGDKRNKTRRGK